MIGQRFGSTWYGKKGTLTSIGHKVECHICGKRFHNLATHVIRTHEMSPNEYRDEFGLMAKTSLISAAMAAKKRVSANFLDPEILAKALANNYHIHSPVKRRCKRSLQETLENSAHTARFIEAGKTATKRRIAEGTFVPPVPSPEASRRNIRVAIAKRAELLRDPVERARLADIHRAALMVLKETMCVWCGVLFTQPSGKQKRSCSDECRVKRQRQLMAEMMARSDVREKMVVSAQRRAADAIRNNRGRWCNDPR